LRCVIIGLVEGLASGAVGAVAVGIAAAASSICEANGSLISVAGGSQIVSSDTLRASRKAYGEMSEMSAEETPPLIRVISTIPQPTASKSHPPVSNHAMAALKGPLAV